MSTSITNTEITDKVPGFKYRELLIRWSCLESNKCRPWNTLWDRAFWVKEIDSDRWIAINLPNYVEHEWRTIQTVIWHEIKERKWNASINTFNNYFKVQLFAKGYPCFGIGEGYRENLGEAMLAAYLDALETEAIPSELIREKAIQEV